MGSEIDVSRPGILPKFAVDAGANTTTTLIKAPPFHQVTIQSASALYVFSGLSAGDSVPSERLEFDASASAAGITFSVGPLETGQFFAGLCCALQSGTGSIRIAVEPPVVDR